MIIRYPPAKKYEILPREVVGGLTLIPSNEQNVFIRDKATWVGYLLIGTYCLVLASMGPVVPYLRDEQKLNYTISSFHFSAWALGGITAGTIGHIVIGKLGCSRAIWICAAGLAAATALLISVKLPFFTILSGYIGGTCGSMMGHSLTSIMSRRFGVQRTIGITEANIGGSLFALCAPLLVGQCVRLGLTWRAALLVPLLFFFCLFVSSRKVFNNFNAATSGFATGTLPVRYWFFWFVIWFSVASEWSIIYWTSEFLEKAKGLVREDAIQSISIFLVTMLVGRVLGSRLARTFSVGPLLLAASAVALGGFLVYWLAPSRPLSLIGLAITGLGNANVYPLSYSQALGVAEEKAGLAAARMSLSTGTAVLITPLLLGALGDRYGIEKAFAVVAALMMLAMILLAIAAGRKK
ncbi:MAG: MFS transporter [Cyanobacteria bacterium SZAS LIN-3]|nr:MFS transporter [Cyanobacteria bacterium SZAS LIN-3]